MADKRAARMKAMAINVTPQPEENVVTDSGTFQYGDMAIGVQGIRTMPKSSTDDSVSLLERDEAFRKIKKAQLEKGEQLGAGVSGAVHRAVDKETGQVYALKEIPFDMQENQRKLIVLEVKTLITSDSPHVVSCYGAFFQDGKFTIIMEHMAAGTVHDLLSSKTKLPEPILASITSQVLQGLYYIHNVHKIIHRDLKPSNLLVNDKGAVKISDFGVSGEANVQSTAGQARCATWVGTVTYMSPERITGKSYSFDSDIWSLGLMLIEMATGIFPYVSPGENVVFWTLMDKIVNQPVPCLSSDEFSPELCDFVSQCLRKDPADRPTAAALLDHPFLQKPENKDADLAAFVASVKSKKGD
eukprot:JP435848.1.p1 GENE.JP435848.1~~JP435848.1.p1  ORF type:complete len:357 (+),score=85.93 JP435848.1:132-1202(+)